MDTSEDHAAPLPELSEKDMRWAVRHSYAPSADDEPQAHAMESARPFFTFVESVVLCVLSGLTGWMILMQSHSTPWDRIGGLILAGVSGHHFRKAFRMVRSFFRQRPSADVTE